MRIQLFCKGGRFTCLYDAGAAPIVLKYSQEYASVGVRVRRVSYIEPCSWPLRKAFHMLRRLCGDGGRVADWTRRWGCLWRVNFGPVRGPIQGPFSKREEALEWEHGNVGPWLLRAVRGP